MSDTLETADRTLVSSEVAPGIHRIEWPFAGRLACCYALVGDERALIVDTGVASTPDEHILPYLASAGIDVERVRWVIASHADLDHTGGNGALLEHAREALLACHELDRPMIEDADRLFHDRYDEFGAVHGVAESEDTLAWVRDNARHVPVHLTLVGGERMRLGRAWEVEVLYTPGHSRGHLSVFDPRSGAAVITDAALGDGLPALDGTPLAPPTYRHVDTYLATIDRLRGLRPELLLTAHFAVMDRGEGLEFLDGSRAYVDRVEGALRAAIAGAGDGIRSPELIAALSPELGGWPAASSPQLIFPLAGHLERMEARRVIEGERQAEGTRWRPGSAGA